MNTEMETLTQQQIFRKRAAGEALQPEEADMSHRHVVTVLVENTIGALNRVANLFSQRGFNLESVSVGGTKDPSLSRMTLVTTGNDRIIGQVIRQLDGLLDTILVDDVTSADHVEREMCLVKVRCTGEQRPALMSVVEVFRATAINITPDSMTFEVTGPPTKVNAFIGMMKEYDLREVARSGRVAMRRQLAFEY
ncbi:MAG: acetolactate synthase small subunit [Bacteroidetes Order II. Incertae sedis bacterium]|jgi:acetolactate synthase-1/3 small subunit|nr:acetolactate synthase small subunit [Bacteroidetes Order II. bacterium]MBT4052049.1 acetolactate synthase small subunit [Bacteroidetes Order II. bacterium]MBT4602924.1 acetolactate synthase small subunit [Bacteroidetes Order II. bacterium]MBT5249573.1 acetolactate synthase small subunit [Bacteroidetes Order II. bacterium]MBT6199865.1 acetolactate synthase small subunit [Bacteroidetes Order II. bacterium]